LKTIVHGYVRGCIEAKVMGRKKSDEEGKKKQRIGA
jgi:hypothetical protein